MLKVLDPCSMVRVQCWNIGGAVPPAVGDLLELQWPKTTGTVVCGHVDIHCIGPTDWLVVEVEPTAGAVSKVLSNAFANSSFRATDVSSALARIQVEGAKARALLAKGCSLNLDPAQFPPNCSPRTLFAGMPVVIRCKKPSTFECIVSLSYRDYLFAWLTDAAVEFE
jgi:sarcosine oxidase subunit gamma